jgi:3-hydroxyisobutyrate dehydrogenase-like beta-hydroxyacid dehydrogenase
MSKQVPEQVGLIGLGNMGAPVVRRLLQRGYRVLAYDMSSARLDEAKGHGASAAADASEVACRCGTVVLSLPNPKAVRSVVETIVKNGAKGAVIVDLSTNDPATAQEMSRLASQRGLSYIDAPVSGGPSRALTGELTTMVGGDDAAVAQVKAVLSDIAAQVEHVGPAGSGSIAKLLNNYVALWGMVGVSQAFLAASKMDVDPERLYQVMAKSSGRSYSLDRNFPKIRDAQFKPNFALALAEKDLTLALDLMKSTGFPVFAESSLRKLFDSSNPEQAGLDVAVIYERLREAM